MTAVLLPTRTRACPCWCPRRSPRVGRFSSLDRCLQLAKIDGSRTSARPPKEVMSIEEAEVVVVGGGQAGIAMSEHLGSAGVPHVILERGRIAEKWRSGRWDSLVANGPAWHDRFPGLEFAPRPETFVPKEQVADYFEAYAKKIAAPIRCGVEVTLVRKNHGRPGFRWRPRRAPSTPASWSRRPGRSRSPSSRRSSPVMPASSRSTPPPTATQSSSPPGTSSWSVPGPRVFRSPPSSGSRDGRSTSPSARTTGRPAATAGGTTSGGSASSASGR